MGKSNYPGEFEQVVMLALARVGKDAYEEAIKAAEDLIETK